MTGAPVVITILDGEVYLPEEQQPEIRAEMEPVASISIVDCGEGEDD